jgi:hypothetical protein
LARIGHESEDVGDEQSWDDDYYYYARRFGVV